MPTHTESICCQGVTPAYNRCFERYNYDDGPWKCITDHPGINELLAPAPLEVIWQSFKAYHGKYTFRCLVCQFGVDNYFGFDFALPFMMYGFWFVFGSCPYSVDYIIGWFCLISIHSPRWFLHTRYICWEWNVCKLDCYSFYNQLVCVPLLIYFIEHQ